MATRSTRKGAGIILFLAFLLGSALALGGGHRTAYAVSGDLDPTFDGDGRVTSNLDNYGTLDEARAVAIQPDGKIVAVGTTYDYDSPFAEDTYDFSVARYNPDGSPDQSFG